jgi:hypothetical protein
MNAFLENYGIGINKEQIDAIMEVATTFTLNNDNSYVKMYNETEIRVSNNIDIEFLNTTFKHQYLEKMDDNLYLEVTREIANNITNNFFTKNDKYILVKLNTIPKIINYTGTNLIVVNTEGDNEIINEIIIIELNNVPEKIQFMLEKAK